MKLVEKKEEEIIKMLALFKNMMKEEWRIHSTLFGSLLFFLFPFVIFLLVILTYFSLPFLQSFLSMAMVIASLHFMFFFFGLNIGAFGLHGTEFMNRRFGHASLIAYSSRSLPVSERTIFVNVIFKDIIYYFFMFILPSVIGLSIVGSFFGLTLNQAIVLLFTLMLSFLIGISVVFFFSTIYAHSAKLLFGFVIGIGIFAAFSKEVSFFYDFPPYTFFVSHSISSIVLSSVLIFIPSLISIIFLKIDYPDKKPQFDNQIENLVAFFRKIFKQSKTALLISKDFLDLMRSRGGIGRIIFSLLIPAALIWFFVYYFGKFLPVINTLGVFSIFLGIYTTSIYTWLTEFDSFTNYSFLPIKISEVIMGKVRITILLSTFSILLFILAAFYDRTIFAILPAFACYLSLFIYGLSITVYLTGLYPNILFFNPKVLIQYLVYITPAAIILIIASAFSIYFLFLSLIFIPVSIYVFKAGLNKWDAVEQLTY
jgi:hypothetical protein